MESKSIIISQLKKVIKDKQNSYKTFAGKLKSELENYTEAKEILVKYILKKDVTESEIKFFRKQLIEICKSLGYVLPAAIIPFGIPLMSFVVFILNKYNIDIVPSYMKKEIKK